MKELQDIIRAYDEAVSNGHKTALATVVQVEGSSYRRPGARMLIRDDGQFTGAISGGCLEGDALRKAQLAILQGKPKLVTYDTTDEDDLKFGVQLGCNGVVRILIEPIGKEGHPVNFIRQVLQSRQTAVIVTLFCLENSSAVQDGTSFFLSGEKEKIQGLPSSLVECVRVDAQVAIAENRSFTKQYSSENGMLTAFVERIVPPLSLLIVGAGNDAIPLGNMAKLLGWDVTVVDGRSHYATAVRFPGSRLVVCKASEFSTQVNLDNRTAVVLMTHNYHYDLEVLRQMLTLQPPYLGVLGPKKKLDRMLDELRESGISIPTEALQPLYGPVGLDLGAETSEEIALSVVAEIQAVFAGRKSNSLRDKNAPIHEAPFSVSPQTSV